MAHVQYLCVFVVVGPCIGKLAGWRSDTDTVDWHLSSFSLLFNGQCASPCVLCLKRQPTAVSKSTIMTLRTRPKFLFIYYYMGRVCVMMGASRWTWTVRTLTLHAGQTFSLSSFHSVACVYVCPDQRKEETETRPWPISSFLLCLLCVGHGRFLFPFSFSSSFIFYFLTSTALRFPNICAVDVLQKIKRWGREFSFSHCPLSAQFLVSPFIWILGGADKRKKKIKSRFHCVGPEPSVARGAKRTYSHSFSFGWDRTAIDLRSPFRPAKYKRMNVLPQAGRFASDSLGHYFISFYLCVWPRDLLLRAPQHPHSGEKTPNNQRSLCDHFLGVFAYWWMHSAAFLSQIVRANAWTSWRCRTYLCMRKNWQRESRTKSLATNGSILDGRVRYAFICLPIKDREAGAVRR
jgi:hypothetical protein